MTDDEYLSAMSVHMISSQLDPRFRSMKFVPPSISHCQRNIRKVIVEEMEKIEIPQVANSYCDTEGPKAKSSKLSI